MIKSKLKVVLADRDMNQKELAEVTGIRPPTISAIAVGSIKQVPIDVMDRICAALDCQPGDIFKYVKADDLEE